MGRSSVRATRLAAFGEAAHRPLQPGPVTIPPATAATATPIPPTINSTQRSLFMTLRWGFMTPWRSAANWAVGQTDGKHLVGRQVRRDMNTATDHRLSAAPIGSARLRLLSV